MIQLKSISLEEHVADNNISTNNHKQKKKVGTKAIYWQSIISDWIASGLKKKIFCEKNNISFSALSYWRSRLTKEAKQRSDKIKPIKRTRSKKSQENVMSKASLPFSQLMVTLPQEAVSQSSYTIEIITPSDYKVKLPASIDAIMLKNILVIVGACHA